ncbi:MULTISPECIES: type II secretion system F family protein [Thermomonas]|jgi:general secretion pathway protein F|uniref:Type II secretion system F family protein n=1 Tax=Thermomonas fusca TaxID=215690 RepID=A0A5R9PJY7_9GAMM|nr:MULTISPECIES: type II secretion system F family protein [Thermomonas]TLX22920.1 type II secretion system F family protein [Thermomonas fusca]
MVERTLFSYEAVDRSGAKTTGSLEAASEGEAARQLAQQGLTPYALKRVGQGWRAPRRRRASARELQLVLQEFTTLLESGVGLVTALSSLAKSSHHPSLTGAFAEMERSVRRGESFSAALRESKLPVPEYVHQLAHAGEATGRLAESIRGGVDQYEYDQRVRQEMTGAMIYPIVLVSSGIAAVGIIFLWVVPRFGGLLTQHKDTMPAISRWTIASGVWLSNHVWLVLLALAAAAVGLRALWKAPGVVDALVERAARLPVVGDWLVEAEVGRWASTLSALLTGRVELIRALNLSATSVRMKFLRARLLAVAKSVKTGSTLSAALREHRSLNPTGYDLVAVGEASGELPKLLDALARLYETTGRDRMKRALQLIEPLAIIIIGVVVGTIMTAIILAITSVNDVPL